MCRSNFHSHDNDSIGSTVGTLKATDSNREESFVYELVTGEGANDNGSFAVVGDKLKTNFAIDFETKSTYSIRVRASDYSGASVERALALQVADRNEVPTDIDLTARLLENMSAGTLIGRFTTVDFNRDDTFRYSLVSGLGDGDNAAFSIADDSLLMATPLNFQQKQNATIRVRTVDSANNFFEKTFTISVIDVNDPPSSTAFRGRSPGSIFVSEDAMLGELVGTFSSVDQNANERFTYSFASGQGDTDNDRFGISQNTLRVKDALDFEIASRHSVRIRTTDKEGAFREDAFIIDVVDVYDGTLKAGALDPSFGDHGVVLTNSFSSYPRYYDNGFSVSTNSVTLTYGVGANAVPVERENDWYRVLKQADGKIIVNSSRTIARYLPNGSLDPSFGDNGRVFPLFPVQEIAFDHQERIIAVGARPRPGSGRSNVVIARYNAGGTIDREFGEDGWRFVPRFDERTGFEKLRIATTADGKIVLAGNTVEAKTESTGGFPRTTLSYSLVVTRFSDSGATDPSFADSGFFASDEFSLRGKVQNTQDGQILLIVRKPDFSEGLLRFAADGKTDRSFGDLGFANTGQIVQDFMVLQGGKIRTVGVSQPYVNGNRAKSIANVAQFSADGLLDTSFGVGGTASAELKSEEYSQGLIQPDGKILVVGASLNVYMFAERLNLDLAPDPSYAFSFVRPNFSFSGFSHSDPIRSYVFDASGNALLLGSSSGFINGNTGSNTLEFNALLMRFSPQGTTDTTFAGSGSLNVVDSFASDSVSNVLVQADGKIILVGTHGEAGYGLVGRFGMTRFLPDGTLDRNFGNDGRVNGFVDDHSSGFRDALIQPDGKILAVGSIKTGSNWNFAVFRYLSNGSPDTTFDDDGIATFDFEGVDNQASRVEVQDDGRIFVVGSTRAPNDIKPTLIRLTANGKLDPTFSIETSAGTASRDAYFGADLEIAMQAGKLLMLKTTIDVSNSRTQKSILQRYNRDGSIDRSFHQGVPVVFTAESDSPGGDSIRHLRVLADQSIILGGTHFVAGSTITERYKGLLVKLDQQGFVDPSFGINGRFVGTYINNLSVSPDGKLYSDLRRHNADGSIDTSFDGAGTERSSDVPNFYVVASAIQNNGDYVIAGESGYTGFRLTAIARRLSGIKAPSSRGDNYSLPANWAVFSDDSDGKINSVKADDGLLANDEFDRGSGVDLEIVRAPQRGSLHLREDGTFSYVPDKNVVPNTSDTFSYRLRNAVGMFSGESEVTFSFTDRVAPPLHNKLEPTDVNQDNSITPFDVLNVINFLTRNGVSVDTRNQATNLEMMCDVNGDMYVSPIDVLIIINWLNRRQDFSTFQEEGELAVDSIFADVADVSEILEKRKRTAIRV